MNVYGKQSHKYRKLVVTTRETEGERVIRGLGLTDTNYYVYKIDKQQGYTV